MSLSAKMRGLIVISALLIFSCNKKERIGAELQPSENKLGVKFTDTLTINTEVLLKNDSIPTSDQPYIYAGAYKDDLFGNTRASAYAQLIQKEEKKVLDGYAGVVDSVVMNLNFDYHYGDTLNAQVLNVYQLNQDFESSKLYFSTSPGMDTIPDKLDNDVPFSIRPSIGNQKIRLKTTFGQSVLDIIKGGVSNSDFVKTFKGLALVPKNVNEGSVLRINIATKSTYIRIHYKTSTTDTSSVTLLLNNSYSRYSRISSDRSGLPVLSGLKNSGDHVNTMGQVYVQSGIGIRTKLSFPEVSSLRSKLGNIAINRAELVLELDAAQAAKYTPISKLYLFKLNSSGRIKQYIVENKVYDWGVQFEGADVHGYLNPLWTTYNDKYIYTFNISTYFHALVYGTEENNGLILAPSNAINYSSVNRIFADAGKIKFKVYYTTVN